MRREVGDGGVRLGVGRDGVDDAGCLAPALVECLPGDRSEGDALQAGGSFGLHDIDLHSHRSGTPGSVTARAQSSPKRRSRRPAARTTASSISTVAPVVSLSGSGNRAKQSYTLEPNPQLGWPAAIADDIQCLPQATERIRTSLQAVDFITSPSASFAREFDR